MSDERSRATQEQLLAGMPAEFGQLAEWCWNVVRPAVAASARQLGLSGIAAETTAARVSAMVAKQVYADVQIARTVAGKIPIGAALLVLLLAAPFAAAQDPQPVTTMHRLVWNQEAAALARAQQQQYFLIVDSTPRTEPMLPIQCTGEASPFTCSTPFPALTPGVHRLELIAADTINATLVRSAPSNVLLALMVIVSAPFNLRVQPPGQQP